MDDIKRDVGTGDVHAFIVRIWFERAATEDSQGLWRGVVIHVPSGKRRYFQCVDEIIAFISLYLEGIDTQSQLVQRVDRDLVLEADVAFP